MAQDGPEDARDHARRADRTRFRPGWPNGAWRSRMTATRCCYQFDSHAEQTGIAALMRRLDELGIGYKDLSTHQSSLEDIFVELVHERARSAA